MATTCFHRGNRPQRKFLHSGDRYMNFFRRLSSKDVVNGKADDVNRGNGEERLVESTQQGNNSGSHFSFGPRRFASKGPRRLFVLQKCVMPPVFEPEVIRPNALLRVVSTCA